MRTYGIFKSGCPTGWTLETNWVGKFLMGSNTAGTTGGNLSHNHGGTVSLPSDNSNYAPTRQIYQNTIDAYGMSFKHTHNAAAINGSLSTETCEPAYITVVFCYKED